MLPLFIQLYLDEDVDVLIAELIQARGFNALTTRDAGCLEQSDSSQLAFAVREERAFLTHNRADFEQLAQSYYESGQSHYGIIIAVRRPSHEIVLRLLKMLNHETADDIKNQIRYI